VSSGVALQCRDSLKELALSNRLVWVPGHCGIHGNEDAPARAGSSFAFVGPEPCLPLAPLSVKRTVVSREFGYKSPIQA
jgi:hypothetical protein